MKKLVLGSLMAVVVSQAAGCIITSSEDAVINAQWDLKTTSGTLLSCPPGTTTAAVYAQPVDTNYNLVGSPYIDLYDCDVGVGNSAPLPPDVYQVWVELTSEGGGNVYATSTSLNEASATDDYFVDVLDFDQTFKTTILSDGGYFQFDWDLRDTATNAPLSCAEGAVSKVAMLSTSVTNGNNSFDDRFPCDKQYGLTGGLLQGAYTLEVSAADSAGRGLGPQTELLNRPVNGPNRVTDLGSITVHVD